MNSRQPLLPNIFQKERCVKTSPKRMGSKEVHEAKEIG
jgi:hypothetical protein